LRDRLWQRFQVHFVRNALSLCGVQQRQLVLRRMQTVTRAGTREAAKTALGLAVGELEKKAPKTARLLEEHCEEILGVYALPEAHSKRMRTTNMLERQSQELKRRTRVVRVFPNEQSCPRLVSALRMETSQEWMGDSTCAWRATTPNRHTHNNKTRTNYPWERQSHHPLSDLCEENIRG
jgi:transposase-like protein